MKIAVIKKNKCVFPEIEKYAKPLLYRILSDQERKMHKKKLNEYMWSVMEDYVEFIEVEKEQLMNDICCHIIESYKQIDSNMNYEDLMVHTEPSYTSSRCFIEILYADYGTKIQTPEEEISIINNIGCMFSLEHKVVKNTCVVIANSYDESSEKHIALSSVKKEDILRVMRRRYLHSALLIRQYNKHKFYYQNPNIMLATIMDVDDDQHINRLPVQMFGYNLVIYFDGEYNKYINETATRLNGKHIIRGDVIIISEMETGLYSDFNKKELEKIDILSYGDLKDREPDESEKVREDEKRTPVWSKYMIVQNRLKKQIKCGNCSKMIDRSFTKHCCNICNRMLYCSTECLSVNGSIHPPECVYR